MEKMIKSGKVPIKMWLNDPDEETLVQVKNLSNLPFAFSHVCLMPDAHAGYGMPIGGVLAADNAIVPNAVGVDIGCGMCAVKTSLSYAEIPKKTLEKIYEEIRKTIPLGFKHHKQKQDEALMPKGYNISKMHVVAREYQSALKQIGTLGGGNHFIEIQKDEKGFVWIMIHSGSRNIGLQVAEYYNNLARKLNEKWKSDFTLKTNLAYLPFDSEEARQYFEEMNYCVDFAFANRKLMMERIKQIFESFYPKIKFSSLINIAHNYAAVEKHFGKKLLIHRKGATSAKKGEIGIIPGSQGSKSYIVEGLGNPESFMSCSHGAGRVMSRNKAIQNLNLEEEIKKLNDLGIVHSMKSKKDLDEAASAYKDIHQVIDLQKDLVVVLHELSPMAVIKG